jgi:hypothetical protein
VPDDPATGWPDARQHLYAVPAGGGPEELLNGYFADSPAFSPDGTKVAFVGPDGLYTVPAGGGAATRVTSGAAWGGIDWSPDGTRIAYTAHTTQAMEDTEIRTVSAGGGAPTDLTDDAYDAGYADQKHPAWSPDGTTIAYQGTFGDIYTAGSGGGARPSKVAEDWRVQSELDWGADHGTPDATDPAITKPRPAPGAEVRDRTRTVAATVRDETTELAKADVRLFIDGARRAFSYDEATDKLSRTTGRLSYGKHRVRLEATDAAGNEATRAWSFRVVRGR